MEDEPERQRGFDGTLGVLQLPSALADAHGLPRGDHFRRQPQGDVASLDQCSVVRRPVSDAVFRFVPGMHSRLHVEIMPLRPSRWPGPRRTLVTAHQRPAPGRLSSLRRVRGTDTDGASDRIGSQSAEPLNATSPGTSSKATDVDAVSLVSIRPAPQIVARRGLIALTDPALL